MKRYAIWNKKDAIITPSGQVFTAEQWIEKYPAAGLDSVTVLCAPGEVNGAIFATLAQTVDNYTSAGCDFSGCETAEDKLARIEAFDAEREARDAEAYAEEQARNEMQADSLASIAASLEYQNMLTLEDVEV